MNAHLSQKLLPHNHVKYRHQIYHAHFFNHRLYNDSIGDEDQIVLEEKLRLK